MLALPPGPAPAPKHQVVVGTALFCGAGGMVIGAMAALWIRFRNRTGSDSWVPRGVRIPEVATNVILITLLFGCLMAAWATWSAKRDDRVHTALALGVLFLLALAVINAQAYVWATVELPVLGTPDRSPSYNSMFYAFTGTFMVLALIGLVYVAVATFRYLGGRTKDREVLSGLYLYWSFLTVAYLAVWYVVYVTK
jgi:heme/copper-type cytochrome/quinol oxidase subunit 3